MTAVDCRDNNLIDVQFWKLPVAFLFTELGAKRIVSHSSLAKRM